MELDTCPDQNLAAIPMAEEGVAIDLQPGESGVLLGDEESMMTKKQKLGCLGGDKFTVTRLCIELLLLVAIVAGVTVLSILVTVAICSSGSSKNSIAKPVVTHSSEYQVSLFPDDWSTADTRHDMVDEFLDEVNRRLGKTFPTITTFDISNNCCTETVVLTIVTGVDLSFEDGDITVRKQFYYHMKEKDQCNVPYIARVRENRSGVDAGLMYIDLKFSDPHKSKACSVPIWPASAPPFGLFADPSEYSMKCENGMAPPPLRKPATPPC